MTTTEIGVLGADGMTIPDAPHVVQRPRNIHLPKIERPTAVEAAWSPHADLLERFANADERKRAAVKALTAAQAADIIADADSVAAGGDPLPVSKRSEPAAQRELEEAERSRLVLTGAAARTYARLEEAIRAELDGWLPAAETADETATDAYLAALAALEEAASRLRATRGAVRWLREAADSRMRELPMSTSAGRLDVRFGGRTDVAPGDLFAALRTAVGPKPASTRQVTGAEARFSNV